MTFEKFARKYLGKQVIIVNSLSTGKHYKDGDVCLVAEVIGEFEESFAMVLDNGFVFIESEVEVIEKR